MLTIVVVVQSIWWPCCSTQEQSLSLQLPLPVPPTSGCPSTTQSRHWHGLSRMETPTDAIQLRVQERQATSMLLLRASGSSSTVRDYNGINHDATTTHILYNHMQDTIVSTREPVCTLTKFSHLITWSHQRSQRQVRTCMLHQQDQPFIDYSHFYIMWYRCIYVQLRFESEWGHSAIRYVYTCCVLRIYRYPVPHCDVFCMQALATSVESIIPPSWWAPRPDLSPMDLTLTPFPTTRSRMPILKATWPPCWSMPSLITCSVSFQVCHQCVYGC